MAIPNLEKLETPTLKESLNRALDRANEARERKNAKMKELGIESLDTNDDIKKVLGDKELMQYLQDEKEAIEEYINLAKCMGVEVGIGKIDYDKVFQGQDGKDRE